MAAKLTIDEVRQRFYDKGFILLSTEYHGKDHKLEYICSCGTARLGAIRVIRNKIGCAKCLGISKRNSLNEIKKVFLEEGYALLSTEYIDSHSPLSCKCNKCGELDIISHNGLRNRTKIGCSKCGGNTLGQEEISKRLEQRGFKVISIGFEKKKDEVTCICPYCNNIFVSYPYLLFQANGCSECRLKRAGESRRKTPEHKRNVRKECDQRRRRKINVRIASNLRTRVNSALRAKSSKKTTHIIELIGCSINEFKLHLEKQFTKGMSWDNYGKGGWHIDHIVPCAFFDLEIETQQKECFNYKNCQPLWEKDNLKKNSRLPDGTLVRFKT